MSHPLVSVCIPAYNAELFIQETLESVLEQDYPNLEVIVSDDNSKDRTASIVREFGKDKINLISQSKNLGMSGNWNAVIRASSGKYFVKLDADDLIDPSYISNQVEVLEENPELVFAHCACRLIDVNGKLMGYERSIHGSFIRDGLSEWPRYVLGAKAVNIVIIRRDAFDLTGGYDEKYRYSGDWAMHRSLLRIGSVFYNDKVLASYRVHRIGKEGVKLLQAHEHLLHLKDIEEDWPCEVPGKQKLLKKARNSMGISAIWSMAYCDRNQMKEIFSLIPEYSNDIFIRIFSLFPLLGGSPIIRTCFKIKLKLRQISKKFLYKNSPNEN
jgi:glycosyltransferase involved in cell wall biosynthesis